MTRYSLCSQIVHGYWINFYFVISSFKTEIYIADLLTNRDDADEATKAFKEAFVSKEAARVRYLFVNQIHLPSLSFSLF